MLVAACGGGSSKDIDAMVMVMPDAPPDAPPDAAEPVFDFSCMGNTQGAAAANVTLSGFVAEIVLNGTTPDIAPAHNATVDVCKATSVACTTTGPTGDRIDQKMTPAMGCPAMGCPYASSALATGGSALDIYVKATKGTNRPTYVFPSSPVTANVMNIPAVMFTPGVLAGLQLIGITQDANKAIMLIAVTDCANMPITDTANLTVTIKQNGAAVAGTTVFNAGDLDPTLAGTFAIFNVPAGPDMNTPAADTEVSGMYKTKALRTHTVKVWRGGTTGTQLRPGF